MPSSGVVYQPVRQYDLPYYSEAGQEEGGNSSIDGRPSSDSSGRLPDQAPAGAEKAPGSRSAGASRADSNVEEQLKTGRRPSGKTFDVERDDCACSAGAGEGAVEEGAEVPAMRRMRYFLLVLAVVPLVSLTALVFSDSLAFTLAGLWTTTTTTTPTDIESLSHSSGNNVTDPIEAAKVPQELLDQGWRSFDARTSDGFQARRRPLRPLRSQVTTSQECADLFISQGKLCSELQNGQTALKNAEIDFVWTWVAENPHWLAWRQRLSKAIQQKLTKMKRRWAAERRYTPPNWRPAAGGGRGGRKGSFANTKATEKHFRSHHEFRFSQRSVLQALPSARRLHLLASDMPVCAATEETCKVDDQNRIGETPIWLNASTTGSQAPYDVQYHWDLFKADTPDPSGWRAKVLPTFNR